MIETVSNSFLSAPVNHCLEKEKCLTELTKAEGNNEEPISDLALIQQCLKKDEGLYSATESFIRLLKYEGNRNTTDVQNHFCDISNCMRPYENRSQCITNFIEMARSEGNTTEAISDYKLADRFVSENETRGSVTVQFVTLLNYEGNRNTTDVQKHFLQINSLMKPWENRNDAIVNFLEIAQAEGSSKEAASDYYIVDKFVTKDLSRDYLTGQFIRLLNYEGNRNTTDVQNHFCLIGSSLREGEKWEDAVSQFIELAKAESNSKEAADNFKLINEYVKPEENREMLTQQFLRILNQVGYRNTAQAHKMFRNIHS